MDAVVQARASKVGIQDRGGSLSEAGVGTARGLQQVLDDDPLAHFILHREDHSLAAAQFLKATRGTPDQDQRVQHGQVSGHEPGSHLGLILRSQFPFQGGEQSRQDDL